MIKKEYYATRKDGVKLYRTYSDSGKIVQKLGKQEYYDEAIDVEGAPFVYIETTIPIEEAGGENNGSETGAAAKE